MPSQRKVETRRRCEHGLQGANRFGQVTPCYPLLRRPRMSPGTAQNAPCGQATFVGARTVQIVSDVFRQFTMNVRYCTFDEVIGRFNTNSGV